MNGRSIATAPPRISGVHSSRCTQIGGENSISTERRQADHDQAEKEDHEHRRAVAGILRREVEAADLAAGPHVSSPENRRPRPQRGQRQPSAARTRETAAWSTAATLSRLRHLSAQRRVQPPAPS